MNDHPQHDASAIDKQGNSLSVSIWRGRDEGEFVSYQVPRFTNQTILDVVTHVQRHLDPTLAYRFACRVGMCGSCAMTVNGRARWTCRTRVNSVTETGQLTIAPLANLPVIRDLATDMREFFEKWTAARGYFKSPGGTSTAQSSASAFSQIPPDNKRRKAANAAIECINCAVCYSACDVVARNANYFGPAALNRAWAAYCDDRDGDHSAVLAAAASSQGCGNCHTHQACQDHCPVGLSPTTAIAGLKRATLLNLLRSRGTQ